MSKSAFLELTVTGTVMLVHFLAAPAEMSEAAIAAVAKDFILIVWLLGESKTETTKRSGIMGRGLLLIYLPPLWLSGCCTVSLCQPAVSLHTLHTDMTFIVFRGARSAEFPVNCVLNPNLQQGRSIWKSDDRRIDQRSMQAAAVRAEHV